MTEPPLRISGSAFCTVNSVPRALSSKVRSKFSSPREKRQQHFGEVLDATVDDLFVGVQLAPRHYLAKCATPSG